VTELRSH